jgi:hypothetical protein
MPARFRDTGTRLDGFTDEILVVCPNCNGCAPVGSRSLSSRSRNSSHVSSTGRLFRELGGRRRDCTHAKERQVPSWSTVRDRSDDAPALQCLDHPRALCGRPLIEDARTRARRARAPLPRFDRRHLSHSLSAGLPDCAEHVAFLPNSSEAVATIRFVLDHDRPSSDHPTVRALLLLDRETPPTSRRRASRCASSAEDGATAPTPRNDRSQPGRHRAVRVRGDDAPAVLCLGHPRALCLVDDARTHARARRARLPLPRSDHYV